VPISTIFDTKVPSPAKFYVQQVFKAPFALISTIRDTSLKMLQLHITHQHTASTTKTTTTPTPHSDQTPLSQITAVFFFLGCAHKHPYQYVIQRDLVLESCAATSICTQ
jgi:hypothetical protein